MERIGVPERLSWPWFGRPFVSWWLCLHEGSAEERLNKRGKIRKIYFFFCQFIFDGTGFRGHLGSGVSLGGFSFL